MALMPDDLLSKRFTPVRFSEGYDMDEVDNYLDNDILPRLQELIDENNRLTKELEEAHNRLAEVESAPAPVAAESAETPAVEDDVVADDVVADEAPAASTDESDLDATAANTVVADAPAEQSSAAAAAAPAAAGGADAAGIIALANRLHDEYVKNGE
ncbi:MAG: DivIVA domain-containing protein, partial [Brachybacterium tyrofermentans]